MMSDQITQLRDEALAAIAAAADEGALEDVRIAYLWRKGSINLLRKSISAQPEAERPAFGAAVNAVAQAV